MPENKLLGTISVLTDSETSYDNIGDTYGGFNEPDLTNHIKNHGIEGLSTTLSFMHTQMVEALRKVNREKENENPPQANIPPYSIPQ